MNMRGDRNIFWLVLFGLLLGLSAMANAQQGWDRTLKMEVALPPLIAAGSPQQLYVVLSGTEGKAITVVATIRHPSADRSTATELFRERFSSDGVFTPEFTVDPKLVGAVRISVEAQKSGGGNQQLFFDTTIEPPVMATAITTDKPLYQPGQVVHIRTISFDPLTNTAAADREVSLEVRNPQGILVWSRGVNEKFMTDQFGVAAADFQLATEIPIGVYTVSTRMGAVRTDHEIMVRRYQLPKFTIKIDTDKPFYKPEGEVRAKITATYSFGEPVKNANVRVSLVPFNPATGAEFDSLADSLGNTNDGGEWLYTYSLPKDLGRYFGSSDSFPLAIRVTITDEGGLIELSSAVRMVAKVPVRLEFFPENNTLVPGVANRIYVFTTYPDGSPAQSSLTIRDQNIQVVTTDQGVGVFEFTPKAGDKGKEFFDRDWETDVLIGVESARVKWNFKNQKGTPLPRLGTTQVRPNKYLLTADETPTLRVAVNPEAKAAGELLGYVLEVRKNGHTVAIEPVELAETASEAGVSRQLPADLFGQIDLILHERRKVAADGKTSVILVRDVASTSVFRSRGDAIDVNVRPGVDTFRPREGGEIIITARRRSGERGPVVLGVDIIDTAIFGLTADEREALQLAFMLNPRIAERRWRNGVVDASMSDASREQFIAALYARTNAGTTNGQSNDSLTFANRRTDEVLNRLRALLDEFRPYFFYDGVYRDPFAWLKQNAEESGFTDEDRFDAWNNEIQLLPRYDGKEWVLVSPGPDGQLNAEKADAPENRDNRTR